MMLLFWLCCVLTLAVSLVLDPPHSEQGEWTAIAAMMFFALMLTISICRTDKAKLP